MDQTEQTNETSAIDHIDLTAEIVSAYVSNNNVPASEIARLIATTHAALAGLGGDAAPVGPATEKSSPAQIRKSITHEELISFEDGRPYKTLKRHLTRIGLTPEAYKAKWGLPKDYPMTAASYSETRSKLAHALGLGQQRRKSPEPAPTPEPAEADKPKRAVRPRKDKEPAKT